MKERACSIVLRNNKILFVQQNINGKTKNVFIGGGIENNEAPQEAALRELKEEANVEGEIIFGPAIIEMKTKEYVFIVNIPDNVQPILGYDPELPLNKQDIKALIWLDAKKEKGLFNKFDCVYFQKVIDETKRMKVKIPCITILENIILHNKTGEKNDS